MHPNITKHITLTYINLRVGMAIMAFAFPVLLILGSWISAKVVLQSSISAFYHTPMRNLFVGVLIAIGSFLYLYKGFSRNENFALNIAGIFAVGVAFLPTSVPAEISITSADWLPSTHSRLHTYMDFARWYFF